MGSPMKASSSQHRELQKTYTVSHSMTLQGRSDIHSSVRRRSRRTF